MCETSNKGGSSLEWACQPLLALRSQALLLLRPASRLPDHPKHLYSSHIFIGVVVLTVITNGGLGGHSTVPIISGGELTIFPFDPHKRRIIRLERVQLEQVLLLLGDWLVG